jgi:hypothetical protein
MPVFKPHAFQAIYMIDIALYCPVCDNNFHFKLLDVLGFSHSCIPFPVSQHDFWTDLVIGTLKLNDVTFM